MTPDPPGIHPLVALLRRFALDWLSRADEAACREIMSEGYTATVGGVTLRGREEAYLPATLGQLRRFPGLLLTVHDLVVSDAGAAMRFSEHGPALERGGVPAAWSGIGIWGWDGSRLTSNVTEEDYLSRRRQLGDGVSDPVDHPAPAPWSATPVAPERAAIEAVRAWLEGGDLGAGGGVRLDDGWTGRVTPALLHPQGIEVDTVLGAGRAVAFHATQHGRYAGGLDLPAADPAQRCLLRLTGLVRVGDAGQITGHVVRDRVGLRRDLVEMAKATGG